MYQAYLPETEIKILSLVRYLLKYNTVQNIIKYNYKNYLSIFIIKHYFLILQSHFLFQLLTTCNPPINKAGLCIHLKMMNHKLRDGQWLFKTWQNLRKQTIK